MKVERKFCSIMNELTTNLIFIIRNSIISYLQIRYAETKKKLAERRNVTNKIHPYITFIFFNDLLMKLYYKV